MLDDIKAQLRRLFPRGIVNTFTEIVRDIVDAAARRIITLLENLPSALMQDINASLGALAAQIIAIVTDFVGPINESLNNLSASITEISTELRNRLETLQETVEGLRGQIDGIRDAIEPNFNRIRDEIEQYIDGLYNRWLTEHWNEFTRAFDSFIEEVRESFRTVEGALAGLSVAVGEIQTLINGFTTTITVIAATVAEMSAALNGMIFEFSGKWSKTYENTFQIINQLNKLPDDVIDRIEEKLDSLFDKLADEVALRIVGESHYKYDATSSFYPTITFIFKEVNVVQYPRRTQIKLRSPLMTDEVTDTYIMELKDKARMLRGLAYEHGAIKAMFVSMDKRTKTLVIVNQKEEAIRLIKILCDFLNEPFYEETLSYIEGFKRPSTTKRTTPLSGVEVNPVTYNDIFTIQLYRVVLTVNGLKAPIVLFQEK